MKYNYPYFNFKKIQKPGKYNINLYHTVIYSNHY